MAGEQSEFNFGISWLNRINLWFYEAGAASKDLNAYAWYHALLLIFREISTELAKDPENSNRAIQLKDELKKPIQSWVYQSQRVGLHMNPELYDKLDEFEICLRRIMDKAGLQTKRKEGAGEWQL